MHQPRMKEGRPAHAWVTVASAAAMLAVAMGQLVNGLSAFLEPLEREFGWARGEIALINSAGLLGLALGGILMGAVADRVSIRIVCLVGASATGMSAIAAAWADSLAEFYMIFFVAGVLGGGSLFAPLFGLVGQWFRTGAGLAIGIVSAGQAVGQGSIPMVNTLLISRLGWRDAFAVSGIATLVILGLLALLVKAPETSPGASPASPAGEAPRPIGWHLAMPMIGIAVFLCCTVMAVPLMHLMPLIQTCGIPVTEAGGALMAMMASAIAGRVAFGRFADRIGALPAYFVASAWQTGLVFGFTQLGDIGQFYVFALLYGFGYGGVMTCVLTTIRVLAPADRRSGATGMIMAFAWAGHGVGGFLGGFFFDLSGGYELGFLAAVLAGLVNLSIVGTLWWIFAAVRADAPKSGNPRRAVWRSWGRLGAVDG